MFFKWLVLGKGGDSSDNAVSVATAHWNVEVQFQIETLYSNGLKDLNASTHQSIVFQYGIAPRCSTLNFDGKDAGQ